MSGTTHILNIKSTEVILEDYDRFHLWLEIVPKSALFSRTDLLEIADWLSRIASQKGEVEE